MNNLMVDLETLGDNLVVQIGACYFDWDGNIGDKLLLNISIRDSLRFNNKIKIDASNLLFWFKNFDKVSWLEHIMPMTKAFQLFTDFCHKNKRAKVWSHYYDIMVLGNVYNIILKRKIPFYYRNWREIRTLVDLSGLKKEKKKGEDSKTHNALDDCLYQVKYCVEAYNKLKNKKGVSDNASK